MFYNQIIQPCDASNLATPGPVRMPKRRESAPDQGSAEHQLRLAFGRNFREVRRAKRKTQEEVAQATGFTQSNIGKIERGEQNITLDTVQKLADVVGVQPQRLMFASQVGPLTLDVLERMASALFTRLTDLLKEHGAASVTLDMIESILGAMLAEARQQDTPPEDGSLTE